MRTIIIIAALSVSAWAGDDGLREQVEGYLAAKSNEPLPLRRDGASLVQLKEIRIRAWMPADEEPPENSVSRSQRGAC